MHFEKGFILKIGIWFIWDSNKYDSYKHHNGESMLNRLVLTKKKAAVAIALCAIIAFSSIMILQKSPTAQAAGINPHPGLVGWWRFDEGSGTIASDSSGNGNNGTLQGSPLPNWVAGKYGDALSFDGTNDYVAAPSSSSLSSIGAGDFTLAAWFQATVGQPVNTKLLSNSNPNTGYGFVFYLGGGGTLGLYLSNSGGRNWYGGVTNLIDGTWHYGVITRSGTTISTYVDGSLVNTQTDTVGNVATTSPLIIGSWFGTTDFFKGAIDEAQIYNRALSAAEIQADFQQSPDFSPYLLVNVPQGASQVITTLSWQGTGNINVTITTPSQTYTENMMSKYQKTTYSTTGVGPLSILNIKRLSISVTALPTAQSWNITLTYDNTVSAYQISVETQ
jgi:hypothetical protein